MAHSLLSSTLNELINLIILSSAQLSTQSLKDAKLSLHISDQNFDSNTRHEFSDGLYCRLSWNKLNLIDGLMDIFANAVMIQKQWLEWYRKCEISQEPCFVFISSYVPNSQSIRRLILSEKGVKMVESHENIDVTKNRFDIFIPPLCSNSINSDSNEIFNSLKEILHSHSIINPKLTTSLKLTYKGSLSRKWTHERIICPFNYHQLGKYFTNDASSFKKSHIPNASAYITPPNYRRMAKPQAICVEGCTECRWKVFFLACVLPPLKSRCKLTGDELSDVNVLLMGPHNTLLFAPGSAPVLPPKTWARWGKFLVKLNASNSNSPVINSLCYVNNLEGETAENSLVVLIGFDFDSPEQDFSKKADYLHFLTSNFTEIIEANESFIQSSFETLLSKLVLNQSIVKTKQDDSFLLGELCNAVNSIIQRSTNPEVKADYLNALQTNSADQTHEILHQKLLSNYEEHSQLFEPNSTANDKRGNEFTPTQPKRQITDQAFEDLENYNEEEDYNYLQELPLIHGEIRENTFSSVINLQNKNSLPRNKSPESSSLLKSPLFDTSSLPPTPQRPEKCSQSSGDREFNALADEFSSPISRVVTPRADPPSTKYFENSSFNIPKTPLLSFEDRINSQNSARTDSSQDFKLLSNEELLFSPSATHTQPHLQCTTTLPVLLSSQVDFEELAREM